MNRRLLRVVERDMRTLFFAALFATGFSLAKPQLPIVEPALTLLSAEGNDGGKKKKDEEKEEDYALSPTSVTAAIS